MKDKKEAKIKKGVDMFISEITVKCGVTLNLGNYESFRIDSGASVRANKTPKNKIAADKLRDAMYAEAWDVAKTQLLEKTQEIRAKIIGKSEVANAQEKSNSSS